MIEMFMAVTILLVLIAATFMALLKAPWWVALLFGSLLVVAINRLLHPSQEQEEEGE